MRRTEGRKAWRAGIVLLLLAGGGCGREKGRAASGEAEAPDGRTALIVSGKQTKVYHLCTCRYAKDIKDRDLIGFRDPEQAEKSGRVPCAACRPREKFAAQAKSDGAVERRASVPVPGGRR